MPAEPTLLVPDWPVPASVLAWVTTRQGGNGKPPYGGFNLGLHVGDDPRDVLDNRARLLARLRQLSGVDDLRLRWIRQVHGTDVHVAGESDPPEVPEADAIYCEVPGTACVVMTADCLPVLLAAQDGSAVAVAHAGWRGLLAGVLEATAARFPSPAATTAWLGPAIGRCHFEVGDDVRDAFRRTARPDEEAATDAAFVAAVRPGKWFADLYALARVRLRRSGVTRIHGEQRCTCCESHLWYSYRCEGHTGRFATIILLKS